MTGTNAENPWPPAAVAMSLVALVTVVTVAAILRYDVSGALQIWTGLSAVVGVLTGAFVTYFFTKDTVATEKKSAAAARADASAARALADRRMGALVKAAGLVDSSLWQSTLAGDEGLKKALDLG